MIQKQTDSAFGGKEKSCTDVQDFFGGATQTRTGGQDFADPCLTTWLWRRTGILCGKIPNIPKQENTSKDMFSCFGASDEARTRYLHLGKVALYRMSYTRMLERKALRGALGRS